LSKLNDDDTRKQQLFNNKIKKIKECARCHQILPYSKFFKVSKSKDKVRYICKDCSNDNNRIYNYKKKLIVVSKIFNCKCLQCNTNIILLPSLQFHHPDAKFKTNSWRKMKNKSLQKIFNWIKKDQVILLCANCHNSAQADIFKEYMSLILEDNLFKKSAEEINKLIIRETSHISGKIKRMHIREKIKEWLRKRFIIEKLYDSKCIGCGKINIRDGLDALEFHHKDPSKNEKKLKWDVLEHLDSKSIIEILIKEECVCLCSNCHSFIHSRYALLIDETLEQFKDRFSAEYKTNLSEEIKKKYQKILEKVNLYDIKINENDLIAPLVKEIPHTKIWKIHLIKIYYFAHKSKDFSFKAYDLEDILEITMRHVYKHLKNFIKKGFIKKNSQIRGIFEFTESGKNIVIEIEKEHRLISNQIKEIIQNKA